MNLNKMFRAAESIDRALGGRRSKFSSRFDLIVWLVAAGLTASIADRLASAQEKSVRPGINKSFENPSVADFVKVFEVESREIFAKRETIVENCEIKPGIAIADIGSGTGLFMMLFANAVKNDGKVYAVDIAKNFVDHVVSAAEKAGKKNVVGVVCTDKSVELPDGSIDVAFICDTYHHFEFPERTTESLHRSLKPSGRLIVVDFKRIEGKSRDWVLNHVRAGEETVTAEIEAVGFRKISSIDLLEENYFLIFERIEKPATPPAETMPSAKVGDAENKKEAEIKPDIKTPAATKPGGDGQLTSAS
jgi:ubiquinone/menaquinone biosynthesis C-methylase UbiE